MGKNLPNQEKKISLQNGNPGCMYNILHVLNRHRWHRVKKMLPSKRNANNGGKHASDQGCSTATGEVTQMEKRTSAETNNPSIEEKSTDQGSSHHGTKTSMRSRLIALITEEMNKKRRSRHRRSSSYPARLHQLSRTNSIHHLEPSSQMLESLPELIATPPNNHDDIMDMNGESSPSSISRNEKHLLLQQNIMEKRRRGFLEPSKDTCVQETSQMLDALDVFDLRKEFLLKMLRDTSSPLAHYLNNNRPREMKPKIGLTKSVSFPVPGATSPRTTTNEFKYSPVQKNADPPRTTTVQRERDKEVEEKEKEECKGQDPNIPKPILHTKVATKRFKYLRQKIKHVIKESRKERHRVTMDAVFHKIPYGRRFTKHSKDEKENETASCHKFSKMSTPAAAPMRRSSSFNDGLSKYSRLLDYTNSGSNSKEEEKPQIAPERERLKLKKQVVETPYRSPVDDRQALKRILSLPDLSSFLFLHGSDDSPTKDPPNTTTRQATCTRLDNSPGEVSVSSGDHEKEIPLEEEVDDNFAGTTAEQTASSDINDHGDDIDSPISPDSFTPCQEDTETLPWTQELIAGDDEESGSDFDLPTTVEEDDGKMIKTLPVFVEYDHLEVLLDSIQVDKAEFQYVKDVLERSGFSTGNEQLGAWHSNYQPVNPLLFDQLVLEEEEGGGQKRSSSSGSYDHDQHLLLFDVINEVLLEIYERSFAYWPRPLTCRSQIHPMPVGYHVLEEVWWNINWYLSWRPETTELQSLDDAVSRDLAKGDGWMNIQFDAECVGLELEEMILDDLLDELLFEDLDLSLYC